MIFNVYVDDRTFQIEVPAEILEDGPAFYAKMDLDMDQGWQMSREFVEHPDILNRCQIAADKLLTALHKDNRNLLLLMAGYILTRMPTAHGVVIDTAGEIQNTRILTAAGPQ
ncbi:MAG: hypothetical protein ACYC7I_12570 [Gammaproteobacteria bacterium]